ncbi:ABC transporter permease [Jonesia quinghaiensis]|uniref:ABC transporter permease n=1 Tax=Jonesia quinghaiensis TaxID=262806 RepID=UPI000427BFFD|nr:ABC transporter permease [Jonesia quinghaiensis]
MKTRDLVSSAISNTFRSKTRTVLTALAIFIGAFTLTLTNGLGTGINAYIDDTLEGIGVSDVLTVTKPDPSSVGFGASSTEPQLYDPDSIDVDQGGAPGSSVIALTPEDLDELSSINGVLDVQAVRQVTVDFVQTADSELYVAQLAGILEGQSLNITAGREPDTDATTHEVVIPASYVESLGFTDASAIIGETLTLQVSDATRTSHSVDAEIVGTSEPTLASPLGESIVANTSLTDALVEAQNTGIPAEQAERYPQASVWFAADASPEDITALKDRLSDAGYSGLTVEDQLGTFTTVIDGIVLVLNGFAVIALIAASFGIVNTLLMSVQERTREIGLMKAMGMGSGKVFGLFSLEATFIGFLGSAVGVFAAIISGTAISAALSESLLADLPGLQLIAFDPATTAVIILVIMGIAFLAGTLPAARAAKADPVTSLRYE